MAEADDSQRAVVEAGEQVHRPGLELVLDGVERLAERHGDASLLAAGGEEVELELGVRLALDVGLERDAGRVLT